MQDDNMEKKQIDPQQALEIACYTSDRVWEGTIYTISDIRYPNLNGRKVLVSVERGKNRFSWVEDKLP